MQGRNVEDASGALEVARHTARSVVAKGQHKSAIETSNRSRYGLRYGTHLVANDQCEHGYTMQLQTPSGNDSPLSPILLSRQQASHVLNLSVRSIDRAIQDGRIRPSRYEKRVLIHVEEVRRFAHELMRGVFCSEEVH